MKYAGYNKCTCNTELRPMRIIVSSATDHHLEVICRRCHRTVKAENELDLMKRWNEGKDD